MNDWDDVPTWLEAVTGQSSVSAIARRIGMPQRTLANYVKKGHLPAEVVVAVARAYEYDPIDALVDHEVLSVDEVRAFVAVNTAEIIPVRDLLQAATKRLDHVNTLFEHASKQEDTTFGGWLFRRTYTGDADAPLADPNPTEDDAEVDNRADSKPHLSAVPGTLSRAEREELYRRADEVDLSAEPYAAATPEDTSDDDESV